MKRIVMAFLLITPILFSSCKKDFEFDKLKSLEWTPDLAVPLVKDSITFEQALIESDEDQNFYIDENGEVSILFYYNNDAFRIRVNDLIAIPGLPFNFDRTFTAQEEAIIKTQDFLIPAVPYTFNLAESAPELEVNKLLVKKGQIIVQCNSTFNNAGHLEVKILNATKNGQPFSANYGPFTNGSTVDTIDISGVLFDLSAAPNIVQMQISGLIKKGDQPVAGDLIQAQCTMRIREIGKFEGYLGQQTFSPAEDYVKITAFNNAYVLGDLYFSDPQVTITIYNSIGIPATVTIEKLWAHNDASNIDLDITSHLGAGSVFNVPSPLINATKPVSVGWQYTNANTANSMDAMFNLKPDKVYFKVKTNINPAGKTFNFFSDTSSLFSDLRVKLPLYGHFDHLTIQDTFDFTLNKQKEIESVSFRTQISNGLPLLARLQIYFTDSVFNKLDSLTGADNILIEEAPVDPSTALPYPGQFGLKDTSFYFDRPRMDGISNANKILVKAVLNSFDNGTMNVKIKAGQLLKLDFNALIKLKATVNPGN